MPEIIPRIMPLIVLRVNLWIKVVEKMGDSPADHPLG